MRPSTKSMRLSIVRRRDAGDTAIIASKHSVVIVTAEDGINFHPFDKRSLAHIVPNISQLSARMRLRNFCGCCTLRTGTIIIGTISLVSSILTALSAASYVSDFGDIENTTRLYCFGNESEENNLCYKALCMYGAFIYSIVIGVTAGLMIRGVLRRKPDLIFPWFATFTTDLLIWFSVICGYVVIAARILPIETFFIILGLFGVFLGLHFYIWLVVFSFYKELIVENYSGAEPSTKGKIYIQPINVFRV